MMMYPVGLSGRLTRPLNCGTSRHEGGMTHAMDTLYGYGLGGDPRL